MAEKQQIKSAGPGNEESWIKTLFHFGIFPIGTEKL